ncbi:MAG: MFS transporter [Candidatus Eisenbacteria bacterium]
MSRSLDLDRYRQTLALPAFRRFWVGFTLSSFGDGMTRVAPTWWVWETTKSAEALALLTLAYSGPVIFGGVLAGWLLDRFDRRQVLQIDNALRGVIVATVPILYVAGALELWHAYVVAAVYGSLFMISLAGGPTVIPQLVPQELLPTANALEMLSFTIGSVAGPPLAGLLAGAFGAPNVLLVDAVTYACFVVALAGVPSLRPSTIEAGGPSARRSTVSIRDAAGFVFRSPILRSTTLMYMVVNIGSGLMSVWLPILADRTLGGGAELYGLLLGVIGAGEVASALVSGAITLPVTFGRAICLALVLGGVSIAVLLPADQVVLVAAALALYGLFTGPLTIWAQTLRMRIIPGEMRGRVFALLRTMMQGTLPAGGVLGGWLVVVSSVPAAVAITAGALIVPGLLGFRVPELQRDEDEASVSVGL